MRAGTTPLGIETIGLSHRFRDVVALDNVTCSVRPGTITGLVGRNGAGKTTWLSLVAALRPVQTGSIAVGGRNPWENAEVTTQICLMREKGGVWEDSKTKQTLKWMADLNPFWDNDYCYGLLDKFEVRVKGTPEKLSTGKRSALSAAMGLATRAPLTIFDEVYLGMDAVARRMFYDELMADYVANPRTIILSSHLLDEVEDLMEDVIVLNRGRVAAAGNTDSVRRQFSTEGKVASLTDVLIAVSGARKEGIQR
ncbi:MAG TPA: ABC transporter ATP-binding protein [Actinomycetaceae bacterium]|nr:ABC transporter ATP-binding protein [Actinomycetaceae bacterium]